MSLTKKVVASYSKSLFQNVNNSKASKENFEVSKITSSDQKSFLPNVYIIGEELVLLSSTLLTSKKSKRIFRKSNLRGTTKTKCFIKYFSWFNSNNKIVFKSINRKNSFIFIT